MSGHQGKKRSFEPLHSEDKHFKRQRLHQDDGQVKVTTKFSRKKTDINEKLNFKKILVSKIKKKKNAKSKMMKSSGASSIQTENNFSEHKPNSLEREAAGKTSKAICNKYSKNMSKGEKSDKKTQISSLPLKEQAQTVKIHFPQSAEQFSCNWKKLQLSVQKDKISQENTKKKHFLGKKKFQKQQKKYDKNVGTEVTKKDSSQPEIWFDDVDDILIEPGRCQKKEHHEEKATASTNSDARNPLVKFGSYEGLSKTIAMDCEMVGVGIDGKENMLARVSIVNQYGHKIYDEYVKPVEDVIDYRTPISGIREEDLHKGKDFFIVQKEVAEKLKGRILVGHSIHNDLKVLYLDHPWKDIRDTSRYKPFRRLFNGRTPSLKKLTAKVLNVNVQEGEHNSVQDAQAAMRLYTMYKRQWEKYRKLSARRPRKMKKIKKINLDT